MKKQVKLTQPDLYNVIKESVKKVILEFGTADGEKGDKNRTKMAKVAVRNLKKGNADAYNNAVNSITKGGGTKNQLADFNKKFEKENMGEATDFDKRNWYGSEGYYGDEKLEEYNDTELQHIYGRPSYDEDFDDELNDQPANNLAAEGRKAFKVNEAQLKAIIRESVNIILNEIGDTPKGNFALNAVRGRRAAKRYRTNMNLKDRADNDRVIGIAGDTIYKNYCKNHELGLDNEAGYRYGFDKGVEKYENK